MQAVNCEIYLISRDFIYIIILDLVVLIKFEKRQAKEICAKVVVHNVMLVPEREWLCQITSMCERSSLPKACLLLPVQAGSSTCVDSCTGDCLPGP